MTKISYEFDPEELTGITIPKHLREQARELCADYVKESVLDHMSRAESPVAGESWKKSLSKEYRKRKEKISSSGVANLELYGDLKDSIDARPKREKIIIEVAGDQEDKADGHCNFSGKSKLPRRRFIPGKGQTFTREIIDGMKDILIGLEAEDSVG